MEDIMLFLCFVLTSTSNEL